MHLDVKSVEVFSMCALAALGYTAAHGATDFDALDRTVSASFISEGGEVIAYSGSRAIVGSYAVWTGGFALGYAINGTSADGGAILLSQSGFGVYRWTQETNIVDWGTPAGTSWSSPVEISRDGTTVAGFSYSSGDKFRAFRASTTELIADLGTLGGESASAYLVSDSGSVVAGYADTALGESHAFRWTAAGGMLDLGTLGGKASAARFLAADGSVVVGDSFTITGARHVFRWTSGRGTQDIGTLGGLETFPGAMSDDGSVIAGSSMNATGQLRVFRWTVAGGIGEIGPADGSPDGVVLVSADGSVMAGSYLNASGERRVFRWTVADGWSDIGPLGASGRLSISLDGSVVAGSFTLLNSSNETRASLWSVETGWTDLNGLLRAVGADTSGFGILSRANPVRRIGNEIVVTGSGLSLFDPPYSWGWSARFDLPTGPIATTPVVVTGVPVPEVGKRVAVRGEALYDGGAPITGRGVVVQNHVTIPLGDGTGQFSATLDASLKAGATYRFRASATNSSGTDFGVWKEFTTPSAPALIWEDIGNPAIGGSQSHSAFNDSYAIVAGGADMWGNADQFRFGHETVSGEVELAALVESISGPQAWSRAGITFRESLAAGAAHVTLIATAGNGVNLQWRAGTDGETVSLTSAPGINPTPVYLRLARQGPVFSAFRSADGINWEAVGQAVVSMRSEVRAGIIACAVSTTETVETTVSRFYSWNDGASGPQVDIHGDLDFGDVTTGTTVSRVVVLTNPGTASLDVSAIHVPAAFSASNPGNIDPGGSRAITVSFFPSATTSYGGLLVVLTPSDGAVGAIGLSGAGIADAPALAWLDIGNPSVPGYQTFTAAGGHYRIGAGGADMWGGSDEFRFGHESISGNGEAVLLVESVAGPHPWSRVGVIVRESLDAASAHVSLIATAENGVDLQWRGAFGGDTMHLIGELGVNPAPVHLKLMRSGSQFTGYRSANGVDWSLVGTASVAMPTSVYAGILACAVSDTTSMFAEVSSYSSNFVVPKLPATVTVGELSHVFDGASKSVTVTTSPGGLNVDITYNGSATMPINAGSYAVVATVDDPDYEGGASATLTIAQAPQIITFAPLADRVFGEPPNVLSATASSGLPVLFAVTAGAATINGSTLTITSGGVVTVSATQAGNANHLAATPVVRSFTVAAAAATISLSGLMQTYDGSAKAVTATTNPPGLTVEITYDGSATPPSSIGNYTVVATIADANFSGTASAALTIEPDDYTGIYFGALVPDAAAVNSQPALSGPSVWGLMVMADGKGTFLAFLSGLPGTAIVADVLVQPDGTFSATSTPIIASSALARSPLAATSRNDAATATDVTVSGSIAAGAVSGQIAGLDVSFSGALDNSSGPAQDTSGMYVASVLGAATGNIYALVGPGGQVVFIVVSSGVVDGGVGTVDAAGQIAASLSAGTAVDAAIDAAGGSINGTITLAGSPTPMSMAGLSSAVTPLNRIINLSTRAYGGAGDGVMIAGFVISGTGTLPVLVRAIGPSLGEPPFDIGGAMSDPVLVINRSVDATEVASNDDWATNANLPAILDAITRTGAFPVPQASMDAMLLLDLPVGEYTATTSGKGLTGVAIAEVYSVDETSSSTARLTNISTRGFVGTGDGIMIPGFVTSGNAPRRLLIRAVGPALTGFGVAGFLTDPILRIFTSDGSEVAGNDDWDLAGAGDAIDSVAEQVGAFGLPRGSKDAALLINVPPNTGYTVHVSGKSGASGVVLAEFYEAP